MYAQQTLQEVLSSSSAWYAIRVKSRCEWTVADALRNRGYEEFLPLYWSRRRWSDRIKMLQLPLFPGYLFCRFEMQERLPILNIPGIVAVVGRGKIPLAIETAELDAIRRAMSSGHGIQPWPRLEPGRTVRIEEGSLRGLEGVLLRFKGGAHLILGVKLLQRAIAVEVPESWVTPCGAVSRSLSASTIGL